MGGVKDLGHPSSTALELSLLRVGQKRSQTLSHKQENSSASPRVMCTGEVTRKELGKELKTEAKTTVGVQREAADRTGCSVWKERVSWEI